MTPEIQNDLHPSVKTFIDPVEFANNLSYSTNQPDDLSNHSALMFYYSELNARAEHQSSYLKSQLELTEALLDKDIRSVFAAKGEKVTEAKIEKEIKANSQYRDAAQAYRDAKYVEGLMDSCITAMEHRRSMMLQSFRNDMNAAMS